MTREEAHLNDDMSDEEIARRLENKYAHRRIDRQLQIERARTREEAHLHNEAKFANLARAKEQVEAKQRVEEQKDRAMRGWLSDPPPPPPRPYIPGEEYKWYKMMGAAHLLPRQAPGGPKLPIAQRYSAGRKIPGKPSPSVS